VPRGMLTAPIGHTHGGPNAACGRDAQGRAQAEVFVTMTAELREYV